MAEDDLLIEYLRALEEENEDDGDYSLDANAKLRQAMAREDHWATMTMKKITDDIPGGFFVYRAGEGEEIIYANRAMLRLFDCETLKEFREWTGNSFQGIVHPDDIEAVEKSITEQIAGSRYDMDFVEYRIIQKSGGIRWVEDYGHFVHSSAGDVFYVFLIDATEKWLRRKEEEAAIRRREETWQDQLESYDRALRNISEEHLFHLEMIEGLSIDYDSIFYADIDQNVIQPYQVSHRISRQMDTDLQLRPFRGFAADYAETWVCPEDRKAFSEALEPEAIRSRLKNQRTFHFNYRITEADRTEYLQLRFVNVGKTSPSQIILAIRSVDEEIRHQIEQNQVLETALAQAKAASAVKTTFLSNMSHDIRTPMNAIVGFTTLAKGHIHEPDRLYGYLEMLENASVQLRRLMDDVLEISRLETDTTRIQEVPCNLAELMNTLRDLILPQAKMKNHRLTLALSGLTHEEVFADKEKLTRALLSLCENAVNYTENGGDIRLSAEELSASDGYAAYRFTVEDNGIGISSAFLEHIFEPFERQKNTTLSGVQGTGLGLTIVKNIIDAMDGSIDIDSKPGKGSTFSVTLSLRLQQGAQALAGEGQIEAKAKKQRRILVVEDNEINMEIETALLEDAGFLVDTAEDGSIALEKVKKSRPGYYDLILMDIQMPVMDGHAASRAIRALDNPQLAAIPIVALSANTFADDKKRSAESGMSAHLAKPIDLPKLLELFDRLLGKG